MQLFRIALHGYGHRRRSYGTPPEEAEHSALLIYFLSSILGAIMSVTAKLCGASGVHFFLLVTVRSAVLCLLLVPLLVRRRVNPFAFNDAFGLLLLRGFLGFSSLSLWYLCMNLLPLSDAYALSFISPVAVALLAPAMLEEATPQAVYLSLPACMVGMCMVAQPTWLFGATAGPTSTLGVLSGILQALLGAGSKLTIRALNKHHEPLESILFSMGFISTLGATIGCLVVPGEQMAAPPHISGWVYLAATTLLALVVQAMFTHSLQKCNAAKAASLDYLTLLWTLLADGLVFHKLPNHLSLAGAGVITAASLCPLLRSLRAHPDELVDEAAAEAAAAAAAQPQQYKKEFYLPLHPCSPGRGSGKHAPTAAAADSNDSTSEAEAVSLLKADVAAVMHWGEGGKLAAGPLGTSCGCEAKAAGPATTFAAGAECTTGSKHAAKLATAAYLPDSSKSWRLGTELEAAVGAPEAGGNMLDGLALVESGNEEGRGRATGVELQAICMAPAAMRTSTEKEQALAAAGK